MPKKDKKESLFTLSKDYVEEVLEEAAEQNELLSELLEGFFESGINKPHIAHALPYVMEVSWLNHCIMEILEREIGDKIMHTNKSTGEKEHIIMEASIYQLQALLIAKYQANLGLTRISYSVSMH